jgi:hypothetical protein
VERGAFSAEGEGEVGSVWLNSRERDCESRRCVVNLKAMYNSAQTVSIRRPHTAFSERTMSSSSPAKRFSLSLDVWAVLLSFALALLVRIGLIKSVSW